MAVDGKSSQEYPVNAGVPKGPILSPALFLLHVNKLPDDWYYYLCWWYQWHIHRFYGHTVTCKISDLREAITHAVAPY